jgi:hypothetical protein
MMKMNVKALALSLGVLWGGALLVVGMGALIAGVTDGDHYGKDFMLAMASIYPGYRGIPELGDVLLGAGYGFVDGAVGGALLAWIYNLFAKES